MAILHKTIAAALVMTSAAFLPEVVQAVQPYKPVVSVSFGISSTSTGEISGKVTSPKSVNVPGSGWWSSDSEGDPLPDGTTMTIKVTRSCYSLWKSEEITVFTASDVAPGQELPFVDDAVPAWEYGYTMTYTATATIGEDVSPEATKSLSPGLDLVLATPVLSETADGKAAVTVTVPSKYKFDSEELDLPVDVTGVELYRLDQYDTKPSSGDKPIATVENPAKGSEVTLTDATPEMNSNNNYYVKVVTPLGYVGKQVTGWIGYDVPGYISGYEGVYKDGGVLLTWEAPTAGQNSYNGSKFDPEATRYKIYRVWGYGSDASQLIADNLDKTEFFDSGEGLEAPVKCNYRLEPYNNLGEGSDAYPYFNGSATNGYSYPFIVGPAYTMPFVETFPGTSPENCWIPENPNRGGTWAFGTNVSLGSSSWSGPYIDGPSAGAGMAILNFNQGYPSAGVVNSLTSYKINTEGSKCVVLEFLYFALAYNDVSIDVMAYDAEGNMVSVKKFLIADGANLDDYSATSPSNWRHMAVTMPADVCGRDDFRFAFGASFDGQASSAVIADVRLSNYPVIEKVSVDVDIESRTATISWDPVEGARTYIGYIDGEKFGEVSSPWAYVETGRIAGDHTVQIQPIFGDEDTSVEGLLSEPEAFNMDVQNSITDIAVDGDTIVDIYSIDGKLVSSSVSASSARTLAPGIYILRAGDKAVKHLVR